MEDNNQSNTKSESDCRPKLIVRASRSIIDEIKAQDIYTLYSANKGPTLPNTNSCYESLGACREPLTKTNQIWRSVTKKHSVQQINKRSYLNLPTVIEEKMSCKMETLPVVSPEREDCLLFINARTMIDRSEIDNFTVEDCNCELLCCATADFYDDDDGSSVEVIDDDESWVDLSKHTQPPSSDPSSSQTHSAAMSHTPTSPDKVAPLPFGNGEEYLRLLREAQKESNQSSARVSLASSRKDTPRDSPKSPPNSPNTEMVVETEETPFRGVYINYYNRDGDFVRVEKNVETDWIWDWSSRPDQNPPKEWRFVHPEKGTRRGASIRRLMVGNSSLFSRNVLYTLLLTNVLSLLLGTGIGIWLSKKYAGNTVTISTMPIN